MQVVTTLQKLWTLWQARAAIFAAVGLLVLFPELFWRISLAVCINFALACPRPIFDLFERHSVAHKILAAVSCVAFVALAPVGWVQRYEQLVRSLGAVF